MMRQSENFNTILKDKERPVSFFFEPHDQLVPRKTDEMYLMIDPLVLETIFNV